MASPRFEVDAVLVADVIERADVRMVQGDDGAGEASAALKRHAGLSAEESGPIVGRLPTCHEHSEG